MSAAGTFSTLVASAVIATAPSVAPSRLMLDHVDGFALASEPAVDLTFDEYAELEPESVAHLDPDSDEAAGTVAAVEVWANDSGDELLVVELVQAVDEAGATSFVDQAAAVSIAAGLGAVDPPFDGAWSYAGETDETWTETVAWNQGPYAVTLTMLAIDESDVDVIDDAAVRQVQIILDETGLEVSDDAAVADEAPPPPTDGSNADDDASSGGGIPIGKVLLWLAVVVGAIWLIVRLRRKLSGGPGHRTERDPSEPRSADEIIADARRRAGTEVGAAERSDRSQRSTDDIIAAARARARGERPESTEDIAERARREARAEVDRLDADGTLRDDY